MPSFVVKEAKSFPNWRRKQERQSVWQKGGPIELELVSVESKWLTEAIMLCYSSVSSFGEGVHIKAFKAKSGGFL
jgi:hypothetical protein